MNALLAGMTARKIIVVPCIVKSALKVWAPSTWPLGWASWSRSSSASRPPSRKKAKAATP